MLMPFNHSSQGEAAEVVHIPNTDYSNTVIGGSDDCFSGVRFGSDGIIYKRQPTGGFSAFGSWLLNGSAASFYISRVEDVGSLDTDAGAGPLQMNSNRDYNLERAVFGTSTATITFNISDDASGSPVIATRQVVFEAEKDSGL